MAEEAGVTYASSSEAEWRRLEASESGTSEGEAEVVEDEGIDESDGGTVGVVSGGEVDVTVEGGDAGTEVGGLEDGGTESVVGDEVGGLHD